MLRKFLLLVAITPLGILGQTFSNAGGAIPDDGTWYEFEVSVSGLPNAIDTVNFGLEQVCINVEHTWIADLDITIVAPDGTSSLLVGGNGWDQDFYTNTCFRADAAAAIGTGTQPYTGDWLPMQQMGVVNNGQDPNGIWKLRFLDTYPFADAGVLFDWSISFGSNPATFITLESSNLPIVVITTSGAIPNEPKVGAEMGIINNGPNIRNYVTDAFTDYNGRIGIELRGNSSLQFPKKSYSFELWDALDNDLDTPLVGMPSESDWVLSANYSDKSLLNNALAFHLGRRTGHWAPRTQHVELIMDGQYLGVYVLMEKIKRDNDRVDIAKLDNNDLAGDSLTGGYIVKIDWGQGNNGGGWVSPFPPPNAPGAETIEFIYDTPQDPLPQQEAYIQAYVDSFETALEGPQFMDPVVGYDRYIDRRSFIDFLIVNEVARNVDGYRLSTYLYKDKDSKGGRLSMGPLWDFDLAWRNADYCRGDDPTGWAYDLNYDCPGGKMVPFWWWRFQDDQSFNDSVRCRWDELRDGPLHMDTLLAWCDTMAAYLDEGQERNFRVWPILGSYVWPNPAPLPLDYAGEVLELKSWIIQRILWLDANWPANTGGCSHVGTAEEASRAAWQVFPNPTRDRMTVSGGHGGIHGIALIDATGRVVMAENARNARSVALDLSGLDAGRYALRIMGGSDVQVIAVMKE